MRPPLVPYNPVITLTWTFSFFLGSFQSFDARYSSSSSHEFFFSFSELWRDVSSIDTHKDPQRRAGGDDPQAPRVDISTAAAAPFLVYSQLLRHYFSREAPGIFAANSSSTATNTTVVANNDSTALVRHPSIHPSRAGRQKKRSRTALFNGYIFIRPEFFNAAHVISSVFIR